LSVQPAEWPRNVVLAMTAAARILVVDDERALKNALCKTLQAIGHRAEGLVVERRGGRIWAEATEGEGACFRLTLPQPAGRRPHTAMWVETLPEELR
jgi:light-regulated signal transduction histidine kinase (bacteriophytochrome)